MEQRKGLLGQIDKAVDRLGEINIREIKLPKKRIRKNKFVFIIRSGVSEKMIVTETILNKVSVNHNGTNYTGSVGTGWMMPMNRLDRWLNNCKNERWMIYLAPTEDREEPILVSVPQDPDNTAQILFTVYKFNGIDKALSKEFKTSGKFDELPSWAIIVALVVFIGFAVYVAFTQGVTLPEGWI